VLKTVVRRLHHSTRNRPRKQNTIVDRERSTTLRIVFRSTNDSESRATIKPHQSWFSGNSFTLSGLALATGSWTNPNRSLFRKSYRRKFSLVFGRLKVGCPASSLRQASAFYLPVELFAATTALPQFGRSGFVYRIRSPRRA